MSKTNYIVSKGFPDELEIYTRNLSPKDKALVDSFYLNSSFKPDKHTIEMHVYGLNDERLFSVPSYFPEYSNVTYTQYQAGKISEINISPEVDAQQLGFNYGQVSILYNFLSNLYSDSNFIFEGNFFIEEISADRTEILALSNEVSLTDLIRFTADLKRKLDSLSYFQDFRVNFGDNKLLLGINVDLLDYRGGKALAIKLYEPLPEEFEIKDTFRVVEIISDSISFEIDTETIPEEIVYPNLKGPNFDIELVEDNNNPTGFFNYNELFSYPVTSSYYELYSLFEESSAQISIDHSNYSDFINFSSAEERLRNFKYKIDLIKSYETSLQTLSNTGYTRFGITGSRDYYESLIEGIVNNFDHYDRFLYFESGSNSWPKSNNTRPYTNQASTTVEATNWYTNQLSIASNFDVSNLNALTNTLPIFLREDTDNNPALIFISMLAQHFDNIWIYQKAVSDKYDADNRINFGISKDLVRTTLENFGVKLYNSNFNLESIFGAFIGESYVSGSEQINNYQVITSGSTNAYLQPMPFDNYQKEIYKRIYHNLPLLTKSKGTERGLRALINSFGIPSQILEIGIAGGQKIGPGFYGPTQLHYSSSLKLRTDNDGAIVAGDTLSGYTSIVRREYEYSDDLNFIEVGLAPSKNIDNYIVSQSAVLGFSNFNIDDYIGDPRDSYKSEYTSLEKHRKVVLGNLDRYDLMDYIRLIRFFDNALFRIVKDFIPGRSTAITGIIIKPHKLERNKAKHVSVSTIFQDYSGSIDTAFMDGTHGGSYTQLVERSTAYAERIVVPSGSAMTFRHNYEEPKFNGELSGSRIRISNGELNRGNKVKKTSQPELAFNITFLNASNTIPRDCTIQFTAIQVTPAPTAAPTAAPTPAPTAAPTPAPTPAPTAAPVTPSPTAAPTPSPTASPTAAPTTPSPTPSPTAAPVTPSPTASPTASPTPSPTPEPTPSPTAEPTAAPVEAPTGGGGGGGGGGCLLEGTPILMADGSTKNIEDLTIGDQVKNFSIEGLDFNGDAYKTWSTEVINITPSTSTVTAIYPDTFTSYYRINNLLNITFEHPVLVKQGTEYSFKAVAALRVGDHLLNKDGEWIEILTKELITQTVDVYNINVESQDTYFANGILIHNVENAPGEKQIT